MAMTFLGAPATAPAFPHEMDRGQVVLLLGTLTVSATFSAGLSPPGGLWFHDGGTRIAQCALLVCSNTIALASLVVVLQLIFPTPRNPFSTNQQIKWYALHMTPVMLFVIGPFFAVSLFWWSFITFICVVTLAAAMLLYIATIQIPVPLCNPVEITHGRVQESPPKRKEYLLTKVNQKNQSGQGSGDVYQILKKSRMHMLLLGTLAASVTYQAGLNTPGSSSTWQGEAHYASAEHGLLRDKRYLVFLFCNASAYVVSLAILLVLLLSSVFSTQQGIIKYYCTLQVAVTMDLLCLTGAYVAVTLDRFCLIGANVTRSIRQLSNQVYISMFVVWLSIHAVVILLEIVFFWALWRQALRENLEHCVPGWLKKLLGGSTDGHEEEEEGDDEEEDEGAVAMELNLEQWRKLLLLLAILAAFLTYHVMASPASELQPHNLVNYRCLAFSTVFIASLSIIAMLKNRKLPAERGVRWHAIRVCVILDVVGLTVTFAASWGYWKVSAIDVMVLLCAVLLCIAFHVALSIPGTPRRLTHNLLSKLGSPLVHLAGPDQSQDDGTQHDYEFGMTGGTNEEPLGVEIASPIMGGAFTLIVAVPVMSIVTIPVKLLVGIMIASIGVSLWQRSLARLPRALPSALQRHQGTMPPTCSSSPPQPVHGMCKLIHTMCSETWISIIILVMWVPSLRHNIKLKFKMSKIFAVLGVLADNTLAPNTTTATAASTTTTATMDTPSTATSTIVGTPPITAAASATSMGCGVQPLVEPRPRRNRRPNSRLTGPDWVN